MQMPDSLKASSFLELPGSFHVAVLNVNDAPVDDGSIKPRVDMEMEVLDGTEESQVGKQFTIQMNNPDPSHSDQGKFATLIQLRMADALGILPSVPSGGEVNIDWRQQLRGRQVIVVMKAPDEGYSRHKLDAAKVYHVDDPECAHIPKHGESLTLIPGQFRRGGKKQATASDKASAPTAGKQQRGETQQVAAPAAAGSPAPATSNAPDFGDL